MAETIIEGTNFNCADAIYRAAKMVEKGKNIRIVNRNSQSVLRLSTPVMLTWGASDYVEQGASQGNGKYEMALQFPTQEYKTQEAELFLENIKRFEAKIRNDAYNQSKEWFGKQHKNPDIIDELFTPILKYPKIKGTSEPDHSKAPTIRIKVPCYDGSWKVEIYDEECSKLYPSLENPQISPLDYLKKGTNVACIIQCAGIWFTNGKFTVTWQLVQALVQKPRESIVGKCFIKINPKEKEILKQKAITEESFEAEEQEEVVHKVQQASNVTSIDVVDSDEEDDESPVNEKAVQQVEEVVEEEAVSVPVVEVVPKKKVVKKKVSNITT